MKRSASFLAGLISIALFTLFALVGCNQTELQRIAQLESRLDSLRVQSAQKDATINEFFQSIDEIEANLNLIRSKEQQINAEVRNKQEGELPEDGRERIAKDIIDINRIMSENHSKMEVLSKKLKASNLKVAQFEKMIKDLQEKMEQRDATIQDLRANLELLNFSVDSLSMEVANLDSVNQDLMEKVAEQHDQLTTAWYAFGTKKELIENKIISREGGFLGIGKRNELKDDLTLDYFTKVNIEETVSIPLIASKKGVEFVTKHPSDSYELEKNSDGAVVSLHITNKEKFWRGSKYLVVVIK